MGAQNSAGQPDMDEPFFVQLTRVDVSTGTVTTQSGVVLNMLKLHLWGVVQDGTPDHQQVQFPALWMDADTAAALAQGLNAKSQLLSAGTTPPSQAQ